MASFISAANPQIPFVKVYFLYGSALKKILFDTVTHNQNIFTFNILSGSYIIKYLDT